VTGRGSGRLAAMKRRVLPLLLALALAACASDLVVVLPGEESYTIATIASKVSLVVPKGRLVQHTRDTSGNEYPPHYFYLSDLSDPARTLILSGWFEKASQFPGIDEYWRQTLASDAAKGLPRRVDVRFSKDRGADVIEYQVVLPELSGRTNSHLIAHWVEEGTWVELHASLTSKLPVAENQAQLEDFFHSIALKE